MKLMHALHRQPECMESIFTRVSGEICPNLMMYLPGAMTRLYFGDRQLQPTSDVHGSVFSICQFRAMIRAVKTFKGCVYLGMRP